jgi:hypothetical protein
MRRFDHLVNNFFQKLLKNFVAFNIYLPPPF